ncbi:MAG: hypothetical protein WBX26_10975 [Candidatus Cybelea sp.]
MRVFRLVTYASGALAAALLAACSGVGNTQSSGYNPPSGVSYPGLTGLVAPNVRPDHHKSWVSPDVKKAPRLLFISDINTDDVYIFTMPAMKLQGTLTGFDGPQGMCSDRSGNIWVNNTKSAVIQQYSRNGKLLKTIDDSGYYPIGCAVNKKNGDLAVTNIRTTSGEPGNVTVYSNGSDPRTLANPDQTEYYFPAYDTKGNLYVNGRGGSSNGIMISECRSGSSSCSTLTVLGVTLNVPGGLNWNKATGELVVDDPKCNNLWGSCLYSMSISGATATLAKTTSLHDATGGGCDVDQGVFAPKDKYFAGGCIAQGSDPAAVARWKFPAGSNPTHTSASVGYPVGAAISIK